MPKAVLAFYSDEIHFYTGILRGINTFFIIIIVISSTFSFHKRMSVSIHNSYSPRKTILCSSRYSLIQTY